MKLPKAKKLPSGRWNVQVMVEGERVSITAATEKEAIAKAAAYKAGMARKTKSPSTMTVGEAIDREIESKDGVLSPSTVAGYKRIRKSALQELMPVKLPSLTQEAVQKAVNKMAKNKSPKSEANAHGLLSAALAMFCPDMTLRTTLPQKKRYEAHIPEENEIRTMILAARGKKIELPLLLALWLGLRASEIRGLTWESIEGNTVAISKAIVQGEDGPAEKTTKTVSGTRKLRIPPYILDVISRQPKIDEHITHMSGQAMYKAFSRLCEQEGLPHYRFHDLRHANASVMLALNVPDKYSMQRMGHATNNMLKSVYQHTMLKKREEVDDAVDNYFTQILQTNLQTEKEND